MGDVVRVVKIPPGLPDESQTIFERCLGKSFPIEAIEEDGRVELLVRQGRKKNKAHMDFIYLWPDEVELTERAG